MRRYALCSLKYISVFVLGLLSGYFLFNGKVVQLEPATEVYKDVAHLFEPRYSNATLIYQDTANDVNYYVVDSPIYDLRVGDCVYLDYGEPLLVTDIDDKGFCIDISNFSTVAGMSGEPIYLNDSVIGYVSSLRGLNKLYCIWSS